MVSAFVGGGGGGVGGCGGWWWWCWCTGTNKLYVWCADRGCMTSQVSVSS